MEKENTAGAFVMHRIRVIHAYTYTVRRTLDRGATADNMNWRFATTELWGTSTSMSLDGAQLVQLSLPNRPYTVPRFVGVRWRHLQVAGT